MTTTPLAVDDDQTEVVLTMTLGQARALSISAEVYTRLCIGQLEHVAELVRFEVIPCQADSSDPRKHASLQVRDAVDRLMDEVKTLLGYSRGGSHGIGHPHVHQSAHHAWEVRKVLEKALAEHRDPNPSFRGVNYDGLGVLRYTTDKAPTALVRQPGTPDS